jgi:Flp pilus assembly protein protease CpaA
MIEYIILSLIIIYLTIASIEDIKKREVYDYINFSLAFIILASATFHSFIIESSISILLSEIILLFLSMRPSWP